MLRRFLYFMLGYRPQTESRVKNLGVAFYNFLIDPFYWPKIRSQFLTQLSRVQNTDDAVDLVFDFNTTKSYYNIRPLQDVFEIKKLAQHVQSAQPKVIVEIGTARGGTLLVWSQSSNKLQLLVSIDLPAGSEGCGYMWQKIKLFKLYINKNNGCKLNLIRRSSQAEETRTLVRNLLQNRQIDFLFIDGDHLYEGVKRDFELYSGFVRPGGLIAFHDIRPNPTNDNIQVFKLWDELKQDPRFKAEEIINEPYKGRFGIGLLQKN
jgi:predicted O-methyltransferase YrrM